MIELHAKTQPKSTTHANRAFAALLARKDLGFFQILERKDLWSSSLERAGAIRAQADQFLFIGIGGSSLGTKALLHACPTKTDEYLFLENVDEHTFEQTLAKVRNPKRLHVVVTSKSGGTLESLSLLEFLNVRLQLDLGKQTTVISETTPNPLSTWAREMQIPLLEIPKDVGGRFSVLSPVGFLPAALALGRLDDLKAGTEWALGQKELIATAAQLSLDSWARDEWITVCWHYGDRLHECGLWWQQLWAESLAKANANATATANATANANAKTSSTARVSTPMVAQGAQDQHSLLQQFMEGARDKWFWFHNIREEPRTQPLTKTLVKSPWPFIGKTLQDIMNAEYQAIVETLDSQGIHLIEWSWQGFNPKTVAAYFMLMQLMVGTLGEMLQIDAFDQPGVELGKRRARDILAKTVAPARRPL
jgi:glucose-6-phosphate isomerase